MLKSNRAEALRARVGLGHRLVFSLILIAAPTLVNCHKDDKNDQQNGQTIPTSGDNTKPAPKSPLPVRVRVSQISLPSGFKAADYYVSFKLEGNNSTLGMAFLDRLMATGQDQTFLLEQGDQLQCFSPQSAVLIAEVISNQESDPSRASVGRSSPEKLSCPDGGEVVIDLTIAPLSAATLKIETNTHFVAAPQSSATNTGVGTATTTSSANSSTTSGTVANSPDKQESTPTNGNTLLPGTSAVP